MCVWPLKRILFEYVYHRLALSTANYPIRFNRRMKGNHMPENVGMPYAFDHFLSVPFWLSILNCLSHSHLSMPSSML